MNPLLKGTQNPMLSQAKQMWQTLQSVRNPQLMLNQMMQNNPQVKHMIEACNGDPEKAFRQKAAEMGIDADEFVASFR